MAKPIGEPVNLYSLNIFATYGHTENRQLPYDWSSGHRAALSQELARVL